MIWIDSTLQIVFYPVANHASTFVSRLLDDMVRTITFPKYLQQKINQLEVSQMRLSNVIKFWELEGVKENENREREAVVLGGRNRQKE